MAFGGPAAGTIPNPLGTTLTAAGNLPQGRSVASASNDGQKNSVVYEQFSLEAFVAFPPSSANADTGRLVTAAPTLASGTHGLPVNFGKGRGNWTIEDARYFRFEVESQRNLAAPPPPP